MALRPNITIVIPVYNESTVVKNVVHSIIAAGYSNIIAVDDGSTDSSLQVLQSLPIVTVHHALNRGKGAATKTGLEAGVLSGADILVTMDGDGQHEAQDIEAIVNPIIQQSMDVVLGVRSIDVHEMPITRRIANLIADKITFLLYGIHVHDTQSGMRAFSAGAVKRIEAFSDAYSYESEVVREIKKHNLSYAEVPIHVRYTTYSTTKQHGQSFINGLKTLYTMIWNILS